MTKTIRVLIAVLSVLLAGSLLVPANLAIGASTSVGGILIKGRIYDTWKAAGGTAKFGKPRSAEVSARVSSTNGYLQRFAKGQVFYSSAGRATFTYPSTITLTKVTNERDALAKWGFAKGVLLRTALLHSATKLDRLKLATELKGGTIIDLRKASVVKSLPDPSLPNVTKLNFQIDADEDYPKYVTDDKRQHAFHDALRAAADSKGTVLIHCTAGKDRTGWAVAMLMYAIGATDDQVRAEYLRTSGADVANLNAGLDQAKKTYGSISGYLKNGLHLTPTDLADLKAKFA